MIIVINIIIRTLKTILIKYYNIYFNKENLIDY